MALDPQIIDEMSQPGIKFDARLARDGSVDPVDKALYAALASFISDETEATPTRQTLAACIGRSVDTVDRSLKRLEALGLVQVERRQDPHNAKVHFPSAYRLLSLGAADGAE